MNEALVKAYFPNQDPIGARVARGTGTVKADWLTIVGVVPNLPNASLTEATAASAIPQLYLPMSVSGPPAAPGASSNGPSVAAMSYVVRSATPSQGLLASIRRVVNRWMRTSRSRRCVCCKTFVDGASAQMAFTMTLLAIASLVSLMLGVVGIYAALSYIAPHDVSPRDPVVFASAIPALLAVALTACWLPARRAARVSPVEAMRAE